MTRTAPFDVLIRNAPFSEETLTSVAHPQRGHVNDSAPSLTVKRIIVFSQCRHGIGTVIPGRSSCGTIDILPVAVFNAAEGLILKRLIRESNNSTGRFTGARTAGMRDGPGTL